MKPRSGEVPCSKMTAHKSQEKWEGNRRQGRLIWLSGGARNGTATPSQTCGKTQATGRGKKRPAREGTRAGTGKVTTAWMHNPVEKAQDRIGSDSRDEDWRAQREGDREKLTSGKNERR